MSSLGENKALPKKHDSISTPRNLEFLLAVKLLLNSTIFTFNGLIYQQIFKISLSSPLSPIVADIILQDLESRALETLIVRLTTPFYMRYYVDDVALAVPSSLVNHMLDIFNSFHPRLQFTMEVGEGNRLNFLDVTMILNDNHIIFDWFHKSTFSGRYLNFLSQHFRRFK